MVPAALRSASSSDGLQPLRLARHWRQVLELIELAFGDALDEEARRALGSMRLPPLLGPLIAFLDTLAFPGESMMPGFVWLEGGQVVGTASVRRVNWPNDGWLVSNVAVHPEWQGRGIGRALLDACLDFARDFGGTWVVLQVRDTNRVARNLYESLGFKSIGEVSRLRRPETIPCTGVSPADGLRPARWYDGSALSSLARTLTPHDMLWADGLNRDLYKTGPWSQLINQFEGCRRWWWMYDKFGAGARGAWSSTPYWRSGLQAAVGVEVDRRNPWHRLRLLIAPQAKDEQLAAMLTAFGLGQLADVPPAPVEIEHPTSDAATQAALAKAGFEPLYALVHMRLNLR